MIPTLALNSDIAEDELELINIHNPDSSSHWGEFRSRGLTYDNVNMVFGD